MKQTPVHSMFNQDILNIMPANLKHVVEVGCSSGALAKAYTGLNPNSIYTGIEIDQKYAAMAKESCYEVICDNIEQFDDHQFSRLFPSDCWVFGDTLEHLYDPWALLQRIRQHIATNAQIIACIPNAQHWSLQAKLNSGLFRYEDSGLMDKTHIRWFTRTTIMELFDSTGYKVVEGYTRTPEEPVPESILLSIKTMAAALGIDPQLAVEDALPVQWVIKAMPA